MISAPTEPPELPCHEPGLLVAVLAELCRVVAVAAVGVATPRRGRVPCEKTGGMVVPSSGSFGPMAGQAGLTYVAGLARRAPGRGIRSVTVTEVPGMAPRRRPDELCAHPAIGASGWKLSDGVRYEPRVTREAALPGVARGTARGVPVGLRPVSTLPIRPRMGLRSCQGSRKSWHPRVCSQGLDGRQFWRIHVAGDALVTRMTGRAGGCDRKGSWLLSRHAREATMGSERESRVLV